MAVGDQTLYSIMAPPHSTPADVVKLATEVFLDETNPPEVIIAEPLGRDPHMNFIWGITVTEGPAKPQEAPGGDEGMQPGADTLFGEGGP